MNEDSLDRSTSYQDLSTVFSNFLRVGHVTDVDNEKRIARVKFDDLDFNSDWLPVLISRDFIPDYEDKVLPQRTEFEEGGSGDAEFQKHKHDLIIKPYMPKVNEQVLCVYEPVRNGRGYILGGIREWR